MQIGCWRIVVAVLLLAFYGNLESSAAADSVTKSFDQQAAGGVNASTIGNRTDYVKLSNEMTGAEAYMICDFTHWEKLAQTSKRDHCNYAISQTYIPTLYTTNWGVLELQYISTYVARCHCSLPIP